jgi:hypothetical protein
MQRGSRHSHEARMKIAYARQGQRHSDVTRAKLRTGALRMRLEAALYRASLSSREETDL